MAHIEKRGRPVAPGYRRPDSRIPQTISPDDSHPVSILPLTWAFAVSRLPDAPCRFAPQLVLL